MVHLLKLSPFLAAIALVSLTGCGGDSNTSPNGASTAKGGTAGGGTPSVSYTYQYTDRNGCPTGIHTADTADAHCRQLKDDSLNNGYAAAGVSNRRLSRKFRPKYREYRKSVRANGQHGWRGCF